MFDGELARQCGTAGQSDFHQVARRELAAAFAELDMRAILAERIPRTVFVTLDPQSLAHGELLIVLPGAPFAPRLHT